jgi:hypothetical protein
MHGQVSTVIELAVTALKVVTHLTVHGALGGGVLDGGAQLRW